MSKLVIFDIMRELRQNAGYTQADVSRILNIQRQTYCNYENATRNPPLEIIIALAELYHVSIDYLFCGTERIHTESAATPPQTAATQKMLSVFSELGERDQKEVLAFMHFKKLYSTDSLS